MRVPDSLFTQMSLRSLSGRRTDYLKAQQQASTGLRVEKPSDDPTAAARARRFRSQQKRADGHARAIDHATTALSAADNAMSSASSTIQRARELAIQGLNDTLSSSERQSISEEISALREHMRAVANTETAGRYIFGGLADDQPPFPAGSNVYAGDATEQEVEVSPGVRVPLGISGDQIFSVAGQSNVFDALDTIITGLQADDTTVMRDGLDRIVLAQDLIHEKWSEVGTHMTSVDIAATVVDRNSYSASDSLSREIEVDAFTAFSGLSTAQSALEAAVSLASQLPPPGLIG